MIGKIHKYLKACLAPLQIDSFEFVSSWLYILRYNNRVFLLKGALIDS